jgi:hypothetical protein
MRGLVLVAVLGCGHSDSTPPAPEPAPTRTPKPPDEMDEKMRHCPLAIEGAAAILEDIDAGVRFTVTAPGPGLAETRRRAHHLVDFAAKRTRQGHGEFDGKGGGRMKHCPVVTDDVAIAVADVDGGARLDVTTDPARVGELRRETRERVREFPFAAATIRDGR